MKRQSRSGPARLSVFREAPSTFRQPLGSRCEGAVCDYACRHRSGLFPGSCRRDEGGGRRSSGSGQNGRDHAAPWTDARFSSGVARWAHKSAAGSICRIVGDTDRVRGTSALPWSDFDSTGARRAARRFYGSWSESSWQTSYLRMSVTYGCVWVASGSRSLLCGERA